MDGEHTHGHGGGPGPDLAILVLIIGAIAIAGPIVAGALMELVHILVIVLSTVIAISVIGGAALLWYKFQHRNALPSWKKPTRAHIEMTQEQLDSIPNRQPPFLTVTPDQLEEIVRRAIERRDGR